jgi:hypothetical protein
MAFLKDDRSLYGSGSTEGEAIGEALIGREALYSATLTITVEQRAKDYIAYLNGKTNMWGCGKVQSIAIGDALIGHARLERPGSLRKALSASLEDVLIVIED